MTNINENDRVLEIGAGDGTITKRLLDNGVRVIAYEIDNELYNRLVAKFGENSLLEVNQGDFLEQTLPNSEYKVFSNIPFNITSEIIKKLTMAMNPPTEAYLIVQKEAAIKFLGKPYDDKNSQVSVLLYPFFELQMIYDFQRRDFTPQPNVDVVLLGIKKRTKPLIEIEKRNAYQDFITYKFTRSKTSKLSFIDWLDLFGRFMDLPEAKKNRIKGSFSKLLREQKKLDKIHRTRIDKNWRNFK
jgi:23S rRNA (adenine-N6)-dimethyltransferase